MSESIVNIKCDKVSFYNVWVHKIGYNPGYTKLYCTFRLWLWHYLFNLTRIYYG